MRIPYKVWRQHYLPQHWLTWLAGKCAHCKWPWFKDWAIKRFIRLYGVNLSEALVQDLNHYASFHEFFIRKLKADIRPVDFSTNTIVSPCDGTISQIGSINGDTLIQAKGRHYTLTALLGDENLAHPFINGNFATIYLAPHDYHRVHMPYNGNLRHLCYIPGKLFSVNHETTQHVDELFARNERVVALFDSPQGNFAVILVGAMLVGSIYTHWSGQVTPHRAKKMVQIEYPHSPDRHIALDKGEEMGYFSLGSTVILLFTNSVGWEEKIASQSKIVVGQRMGHFLT